MAYIIASSVDYMFFFSTSMLTQPGYERDLDDEGRLIGDSTLNLIYMDEETAGRLAKGPPKLKFPEIRDINGQPFLHISMTEMKYINHVLCAFHVDMWAKKRGYCYETGGFHLPVVVIEEELEALRVIDLEKKNYYDAEEMFGDGTDAAELIMERENHMVDDEELEHSKINDEEEESITIVEEGQDLIFSSLS